MRRGAFVRVAELQRGVDRPRPGQQRCPDEAQLEREASWLLRRLIDDLDATQAAERAGPIVEAPALARCERAAAVPRRSESAVTAG